MSASEYQRYRFGPLERRGLIGSLRPAQVILIAASLTGGVILMRALSSGIGVVAALALALLAVAVLLLADQRPLGGGVASDRRPARRRGERSDVTSSARPPRRPERGSRQTGDRSRSPRSPRSGATSSCSPRRSTARRSACSRIVAPARTRRRSR